MVYREFLYHFCYLSLVVTHSQQGIYLVSLVLGKLCEAHIVPMSFGISAHLNWQS